MRQSKQLALFILGLLPLLLGCQGPGNRVDPFDIDVGMKPWEVNQRLPWSGYRQALHDCPGDICADYWSAAADTSNATQPAILTFYLKDALAMYMVDPIGLGEFRDPPLPISWCNAQFHELVTKLSAKYGTPQLSSWTDHQTQEKKAIWHSASAFILADEMLGPEGLPGADPVIQCLAVSARIYAGSVVDAAALDARFKMP